MRFGLLSLVLLCACGRTEPVHYSSYGDETDERPRLPDGGVACADGSLALLPARPVVMLVVDRSSSMNQTFPGTGSSKWASLKGALHQQLPSWNDSLELGVLFFPSGSGSSCAVNTAADLTPAYQSVPQVLSVLDARSPGGATPTALAIEHAGAVLTGLRTASSAKAVILATDGAPDCNAALSPTTCTCVGGGATCAATRCLDDVRTVDRVTQLFAAGIPTWVIGLRSSSDATFVSVLNRMADAGGNPMSGVDHFFSAASQTELESAFSDIRRQVGACRYLTTSVPDVGGSIELSVDGQFTPYDEHGLEGWQWVDPGNGELRLVGTACTRAEATTLDKLSVVVRCAQSP
jgi:hypothetical protein